MKGSVLCSRMPVAVGRDAVIRLAELSLIFDNRIVLFWPGGGIGRPSGFRIQCPKSV